MKTESLRTVMKKTGFSLPLHLPGTGRGLKKSGKSNLKGSKLHIWHKLWMLNSALKND